MNKFEKKATEITVYGEIVDMLEHSIEQIREYYMYAEPDNELSEYARNENERATVRIETYRAVIKSIEKLI